MKKNIFLLIFLLFAFPAYATDYHIDKSCSTGGTGTSQTCDAADGPFLTIAAAQAAVTGSHPNDRLLIKKGTPQPVYREQWTSTAYGTAGGQFTLGTYGSGTMPKILGSVSKNDVGDWTQDSAVSWTTFETWNGAVEDKSWTQTPDGGTVDDDYATSPAPLEGAQSVSLYGTSGYPGIYTTDFTAGPDYYGRLMFNSTFPGTCMDAYLLELYNANGDSLGYLRPLPTGANIQCVSPSGSSQSGSTTILSGTTYYLWWEFHASTGNDGTIRAWINTTSTKPATPECEVIDGNVTGNLAKILIEAKGEAGGARLILDDLKLNTVDPESYSANIWYATTSVKPNGMWRSTDSGANWLELLKVTGKEGIVGDGNWWADASRVYLYSTANPGGISGWEIEVSQRDYCAQVNNPYVTVDGIECRFTQWSGVDVIANNSIIQNNKIWHTWGSGLFLANSNNHTITGNNIYRVGIHYVAPGAPYSEQTQGMQVANTNNVTITNNVVAYTGRAGVSLLGQSINSGYVFTGNEVSYAGQNLQPTDGNFPGMPDHGYCLQLYGWTDQWPSDYVVAYNYIHDCAHACIKFEQSSDNALIHHNLLVNGGFTGGDYYGNVVANGAAGSTVTNLKFYSNTLVQPDITSTIKPNIKIAPGGIKLEGAIFKNNIFYNANSNSGSYRCPTTHVTPPTFNKNIHWTDGQAGLIEVENVQYLFVDRPPGFETNGINDNPDFVSSSDFHLQTGSPAIDAADPAVWSGTASIHSYNNVPITNGSGTVITPGGAIDMGAYEQNYVPNAFSFTDVINALISSVYTSNTITVAGLETASPITITGGTYSKNGGAYTGDAGTVVATDQVSVRVTSSGSYNTAVNAALTIGGISDTYTVTTLPTPPTGRDWFAKPKIMRFKYAP